MKISDILKKSSYKLLQGNMEIDITNISRNSSNIKDNGLFFCILGIKSDGHKFVEDAIKNGAKALIVQRDIRDEFDINSDITIIMVENVRREMAIMSAIFYDNPAKKMKIIALVGTKGKTTSVYMIASILRKANKKTGIIGTIEVNDGDKIIPSDGFTTPEADDLHKFLSIMYENNCEYVVMEASSQGAKMYRTYGMKFDIAIFTGISPDHIGAGEHENFEDYFNCKKMLLKQAKVLIYNKDDDLSDKMTNDILVKKISFSVDENSDYVAKNIMLTRNADKLGTMFYINDNAYTLNLPGSFNVHNALAAIIIADLCGISYEIQNMALMDIKVKGRMESVRVSDDFAIFIDYAHNAVALKSSLDVLMMYKPKRLVCLFGCGGNRDRNRRFSMGEISGKMADLTIVTSDNPRFEEPEDIVDDIIEGIKKTPGQYIKIVDRREAIAYAIKNAKEGDIILLAGKGHEDYQEIKGKKYKMDERDIIKDIVNKCTLL